MIKDDEEKQKVSAYVPLRDNSQKIKYETDMQENVDNINNYSTDNSNINNYAVPIKPVSSEEKISYGSSVESKNHTPFTYNNISENIVNDKGYTESIIKPADNSGIVKTTGNSVVKSNDDYTYKEPTTQHHRKPESNYGKYSVNKNTVSENTVSDSIVSDSTVSDSTVSDNIIHDNINNYSADSSNIYNYAAPVKPVSSEEKISYGSSAENKNHTPFTYNNFSENIVNNESYTENIVKSADNSEIVKTTGNSVVKSNDYTYKEPTTQHHRKPESNYGKYSVNKNIVSENTVSDKIVSDKTVHGTSEKYSEYRNNTENHSDQKEYTHNVTSQPSGITFRHTESTDNIQNNKSFEYSSQSGIVHDERQSSVKISENKVFQYKESYNAGIKDTSVKADIKSGTSEAVKQKSDYQKSENKQRNKKSKQSAYKSSRKQDVKLTDNQQSSSAEPEYKPSINDKQNIKFGENTNVEIDDTLAFRYAENSSAVNIKKEKVIVDDKRVSVEIKDGISQTVKPDVTSSQFGTKSEHTAVQKEKMRSAYRKNEFSADKHGGNPSAEYIERDTSTFQYNENSLDLKIKDKKVSFDNRQFEVDIKERVSQDIKPERKTNITLKGEKRTSNIDKSNTDVKTKKFGIKGVTKTAVKVGKDVAVNEIRSEVKEASKNETALKPVSAALSLGAAASVVAQKEKNQQLKKLQRQQRRQQKNNVNLSAERQSNSYTEYENKTDFRYAEKTSDIKVKTENVVVDNRKIDVDISSHSDVIHFKDDTVNVKNADKINFDTKRGITQTVKAENASQLEMKSDYTADKKVLKSTRKRTDINLGKNSKYTDVIHFKADKSISVGEKNVKVDVKNGISKTVKPVPTSSQVGTKLKVQRNKAEIPQVSKVKTSGNSASKAVTSTKTNTVAKTSSITKGTTLKGAKRNLNIDKAKTVSKGLMYGVKEEAGKSLKSAIASTPRSITKVAKIGTVAAVSGLRGAIKERSNDDYFYKVIDTALDTKAKVQTTTKTIKYTGKATVNTAKAVSKVPKNTVKGIKALKRRANKIRKFARLKKVYKKRYAAAYMKKGAVAAVKTTAQVVVRAVTSIAAKLIAAGGAALLLIVAVSGILLFITMFMWQTSSEMDTTKLVEYISQLDYAQQNSWFAKGKTNVAIEKENDNERGNSYSYHYLLAVDAPPETETDSTEVDISNIVCQIRVRKNSDGQTIAPSYSSYFNREFSSADEMLEEYRWSTDDYRAALAYLQVKNENLGWVASTLGFVGSLQLKHSAKELHELTYNQNMVAVKKNDDDTYEYNFVSPTYSVTSSVPSASGSRVNYYYFGRKYSVDYLIKNDMVRFSDDDEENEQQKQRYEYVYKLGNIGVAILGFPLELAEDETISSRIVKHYGQQLCLEYSAPTLEEGEDVYGTVTGRKTYHYANDLSADSGDVIYAPISGLCEVKQRENRGYEYVISTSYNGTDFNFDGTGYVVKISCSSSSYIPVGTPTVVKKGDPLGTVAHNITVNYVAPSKTDDTEHEDEFTSKLFPCCTNTDFSSIGANVVNIPACTQDYIHIELYKLPCDFDDINSIADCVLAPELYFSYNEEVN